MSKATNFDVFLKLVTLLPLLVVLFYLDTPIWLSIFHTENIWPLLIGAICISSYGMVLRRKSTSAYLQLWNSSFGLGFVAISVAVAAYLTGSFYFSKSFFHIEALILMVLGYLLLRFDKRFVRALSPAMAIIGIAFIPLLPLPNFGLVSGVIASLSMLVIFYFAYAGKSSLNHAVPALILAIGLFFWLKPMPIYMFAVMPALLLIFTLPKKLRGIEDFRVQPDCAHHVRSSLVQDYCVICGNRLNSFHRVFRPNLLGLLIMIVVVFSIFSLQVPILTLSGTSPYNTSIGYSGYASNPTPHPPVGWLINSSEPQQLKGDIYSSRIVYVPSFHPEARNYTLIYALGSSSVFLGPGTGNDLLGWNITLHDSYSLGPVQGAVTAYQAGDAIMMNFAGSTSLEFINSSTFQTLFSGVSITRTFQSATLSNATSIFESDITTLFGPIFNSERTSSTWTTFFHNEQTRIEEIVPALIVMTTVASIAWVAYATKIFDYRIDRVIDKASILSDEEFSLFETMSSMSRKENTTLEIAEVLPDSEKERAKEDNFSLLVHLLDRLRVKRVIRPVLSDRGNEIVYAWKVLP